MHSFFWEIKVSLLTELLPWDLHAVLRLGNCFFHMDFVTDVNEADIFPHSFLSIKISTKNWILSVKCTAE